MESSRARLLVRPSLDTKFHIDFAWWDRNDQDLQIYLRSHLCSDHQATYEDWQPGRLVDRVDPETGEVTRVDGLLETLASHCSRQPGFLAPDSSLINAVFRVLLANANVPLSTLEIADRLHRPAPMILRTLSGPQVYKGIRPDVQ
jgi:hypothetical protein